MVGGYEANRCSNEYNINEHVTTKQIADYHKNHRMTPVLKTIFKEYFRG